MNQQIGFLLNKSLECLRSSNLESADLYLKQAIRLQTNNPHTLRLLGVIAAKRERYSEALNYLKSSLKLLPKNSLTLSNLGNVFLALRDYDKALDAYDKSINLDPKYEEVWSNKGNALYALKRFEEAIAHYDKALGLRPDYHEASWNKSLSLLLQGDFSNGLPLYESRWKLDKVSKAAGKRVFDKPTWLGLESLQSKTILLYGEQGLGDFIQFCRYSKPVSDLGAQVILEVPESLVSLSANLQGVSRIVIQGGGLPPFDFQCPLLSLPLALQTNVNNIPHVSSYITLHNIPHKVVEWRTRLGLKVKPRIGLVWSGNPQHNNDNNRSLLLKDILPYLPNNFEYISLQKDIRDADKLTLESNPKILNFSNNLNDFGDTAALIDALDLVITVDTSVAHLSGALGKKTWVLLSHVPDWRWLLDRNDSPWYAAVNLYRQSTIDDWGGALENIKKDLLAFDK